MMMPSIFGENLFDDWMDDFPFETILWQERILCMANMQRTYEDRCP